MEADPRLRGRSVMGPVNKDPVIEVPTYTDENAQALQQLAQAITWGQVILTSQLADSIARLNGACAELVRRKREAEQPDLPPNDPRFA